MKKKHLISNKFSDKRRIIMKFLLNTGWMKTLISKAITFGVTKKAGIKADLGINDLVVEDDENGVTLHLDVTVKMSKEELEKIIKDLI
jgi:hypothetical protein